jgi:hypothetical protein
VLAPELLKISLSQFPSLQRARLDRLQAGGAPAVGDVLRACTCTTFVFPTNSLFGAQPPQRHIVCYGADQQKWTQVHSLSAAHAVSQHAGTVDKACGATPLPLCHRATMNVANKLPGRVILMV